jgi:hypothetical protein
MADTAVTLKLPKKPKKTKLELEFDKAERERERYAERSKKATALREKREKAAAARSFKAQAKELIAVFRKKTPVKIGDRRIVFTFRNHDYYIVLTHWTIGGNSSDVDDYETKHEGWRIYPHNDWNDSRELFEIEKYSTPPRLKPTPEGFSNAIVDALKEYQTSQDARNRANTGNYRYSY